MAMVRELLFAENIFASPVSADGEIDANIKLLKDDLDAVAKRMKAAIRKLAAAPLELDVIYKSGD